MDIDAVLAEKLATILPRLNEKQRRLVLAAEARALGHGGIARVARAASVSPDDPEGAAGARGAGCGPGASAAGWGWPQAAARSGSHLGDGRSEERRVGKECR